MSAAAIPDQTRLAQRLASDPDHSAFVSANAGSGKTYVLVARVVRLLLAGADPASILCLTFTKAAAANMAGRVFALLAEWTTLPDAALRQALSDLTGKPPTLAERKRARGLFARAIETPGGLKIQTIHAFCERLLQLFPFEANVPAAFRVLEDDKALRRDAIAQGAGEPALAAAMERLALDADEDGLDALLGEMMRQAEAFESIMQDPQASTQRLCQALGIDAQEGEQDCILAYLSDGLWQSDWQAIANAFDASSKPTSRDQAPHLRRAANPGIDPKERLAAACRLLLTGKGEAKSTKSLATNDVAEAMPSLVEDLQTEQNRLLDLLDRLQAIACRDRTVALWQVSGAILSYYQSLKRERGVLDFQDLIKATLDLLARQDAAFVLYKLDMRVAHVLIDEAQDTSQDQWDILTRLTAEFTAGAGAHDGKLRTVFAVGDEKQSIYSFQGAAPKAFGEMRRLMRLRHERAALGFQDVRLTVSFRSSAEILAAVDHVFALPQHHAGLVYGEPEPTVHAALSGKPPGFVLLWDVTGKEETIRDDADWTAPVDRQPPGAPAIQLANRIAGQICKLIETGDPTGAPVAPGDILVLVRRRGLLFDAVIEALKRAGLPVAGADRLVVAEHLAVKDLLALGRMAVTPQDDLSLAALLRSPLFDLPEAVLFDLAAPRSGSLFEALRQSDHPAAVAASERLDTLLRRASFEGPFTFYARVLETEGGRAQLLARMGSEAADAIDAFLNAAQRFEHEESAALAQFLLAFEGSDRQIKRDMDQSADEIRVMTVHAAKGLEAPIVILPDTTSAPVSRHEAKLLALGARGSNQPLIVWSPSAARDPRALAEARATARQAQEEESRRLLYVALTRAERGLIIAGAHAKGIAPPQSWHAMIDAGLDAGQGKPAAHLIEIVDADGRIRSFKLAEMPDRAQSVHAKQAQIAAEPVLQPPDWLFARAATEPSMPPPLRPSGALAGADMPERPLDTPAMATALGRGRLVHGLLETMPSLPAEARPAAAQALAERFSKTLPADTRQRLVIETLELMADTRLAHFFGPESLAEVPVAGSVSIPGRKSFAVSGQIDRLCLLPGEAIILDYKTALQPPQHIDAVPTPILTQLALYRALIASLFPDRTVKVLLVYTAGPRLFWLPQELLETTLAEAPLSA